MNPARLNDWLQVIGLFGVIASLIFVGLQMMQDREIALSAIYQERSAVAAELFLEAASNDVIRRAQAKTFGSVSEPLTQEEAWALTQYLIAGKQLGDNSHYQWERGFASDEHWQQIRATLKTTLRHPFSRTALMATPMRPSFQRVVQEIIAEIDAESPSR